MKSLFSFFVVAAIFMCPASSFSQITNDSLLLNKSDSNKPSSIKLRDSNKKIITADTSKPLKKQIVASKPDTPKVNIPKDTIHPPHITILKAGVFDSSQTKKSKDTSNNTTVANTDQNNAANRLLRQNRFINLNGKSAYFIQDKRHPMGKEFLFYSIYIIVLILGIFKMTYSGYFKNLFRVYFNTSLRQIQLADQLLQAKLPSSILNIFFTLTAGMYIWLLFNHYHPPRLISHKMLLPFCIMSMAVIYLIKFSVLKFMGWMSNIKTTVDNYIFAIFMVNKITGIFLVPVIIMLAFLPTEYFTVVANISFMMLGLFFLSRYIKSYGAVEKKLILAPFHFILYIIGAEIIPLMIIYKVATDYFIW